MKTAAGKFFQLPASEKKLIIIVVILLGTTRSFLRIFRFSQLQSFLSRSFRSTGTNWNHQRYKNQLIRAISRTRNQLPWLSTCLTQAIVAQYLLARQGISSCIRIGVMKGVEDDILAHAWLECDGEIVIGGSESPNDYHPLRSANGLERNFCVGHYER